MRENTEFVRNLMDQINCEVLEVYATFGRRLRDVTSDDITVQHARGQLQAYQKVLDIVKGICGV